MIFMARNTLIKAERIHSKKIIDAMFAGGSKSFSIFPIRVVYMPVEPNEKCAVSILISVPKKKNKRAVKRNRIKRQIREAYRKNKHQLTDTLNSRNKGLAVAFIYLGDRIIPSSELEEKIIKTLTIISEKTV